MEGTIQQGTITRLKEGFGFIRGTDGIDRFFHRSGLDLSMMSFEDLREGDHVAFTEIAGEKGPRAIDVRVL